MPTHLAIPNGQTSYICMLLAWVASQCVLRSQRVVHVHIHILFIAFLVYYSRMHCVTVVYFVLQYQRMVLQSITDFVVALVIMFKQSTKMVFILKFSQLFIKINLYRKKIIFIKWKKHKWLKELVGILKLKNNFFFQTDANLCHIRLQNKRFILRCIK